MKSAAINAVVVTIVLCLPAGIALALYTGDPAWLFLSLLAFIVLYAGPG